MENEEESTHRKVNTGTGLAFVAIGVIGVLWLAERLFFLGDGPQAIPLVGKFLAFDAAARTTRRAENMKCPRAPISRRESSSTY